nr:hypothetical protein [Tanacetum cinerariifolium]
IELTTDYIRNSKAYKEYYACGMGEAAPKPKASARKKKAGSESNEDDDDNDDEEELTKNDDEDTESANNGGHSRGSSNTDWPAPRFTSTGK